MTYFNLSETKPVSPAVATNAANIQPKSWTNPKADLIEIDAQCLPHAAEIFDSYLWEGKRRGSQYEAQNVSQFGRYIFNPEAADWSQKPTSKTGHGVISFMSYMLDIPIIEAAWELEDWLAVNAPLYEPRPQLDPTRLFGLELLQQNPDLDIAVLLCSNEQAAYAARYLLPGYVCMAVREGANIDRVDFSPLKNRSVFIWPDHGEAGQKWAKSIAAALFKIDSNASVYKLKPLMYLHEWSNTASNELKVRTKPIHDGFNASDALIEGWTSGMFCEVFLKLIQPVKSSADIAPTFVVHIGEKLTNREHVDNIVAKYAGNLQYINGEPYTYRDGHWPMLDERVDVTQPIAHYLGEQVSKAKVNELLTLVQIFQARTEQAVAADLNLICLLNGTLDTRTGKLLSHNPNHNLKSQINCEWNPFASCNRWLLFLDEIFVNDPDKEQKIQLLQEWFGYCMIPDNSQHKFLWLVGGGGNGKSVLLDILRLLIGSRFVSDAHIERLGKPAVLAELENKLVNISSEMSAEATLSDSNFKAIVAGDFIEAERKFKPSFSFKPYVRMIGATNHLPRLLDLSDGFFRRAIILTFNRKFEDADRDPQLIEKLTAELPGILIWAVQGLKNLRERSRFEIPSSSIEALKQYKCDSDPERMYFDECLMLDPNGQGMSPNELYAGYVVWCRASGYRPKAKNNFGKRLPDFGIDFVRGHSGKRWLVTTNPASYEIWNEARLSGSHLT